MTVRAAIVVAVTIAATTARADAPLGWEVRVPEKIEVARGQVASVPIAIALDRGITVSKDGPVLIDVAADPGLYVRKRRLLRADAVDPEADLPRFVIPVRGDTAGDHVVKLRIRLWLCGGKVCRPLDLKRQTIITVAAPATPTP